MNGYFEYDLGGMFAVGRVPFLINCALFLANSWTESPTPENCFGFRFYFIVEYGFEARSKDRRCIVVAGIYR